MTGTLLPCSFAKGALSRILPGWRTGNKVIQAPGALGKMREGRNEEREREAGREEAQKERTAGARFPLLREGRLFTNAETLLGYPDFSNLA